MSLASTSCRSIEPHSVSLKSTPTKNPLGHSRFALWISKIPGLKRTHLIGPLLDTEAVLDDDPQAGVLTPVKEGGCAMKTIRAALSAVAVLTVTGCASLQVRTDSDPQASFGQLRTYDWNAQTVHAFGHPAVNSPLVEQRIRQAVDSTLRHMGYQRVTTGAPDFHVRYSIVAEPKTRVDPGSGYSGYGYGGYGHRGFGRPSRAESSPLNPCTPGTFL